MKRMLIYPYGAEVEHLVDFHNLLKDLQPVGLVKLRGWDEHSYGPFIKRKGEAISDGATCFVL